MDIWSLKTQATSSIFRRDRDMKITRSVILRRKVSSRGRWELAEAAAS